MSYLSTSTGMSTSGGIEFALQGILDHIGSGAPLCLSQGKNGYTKARLFKMSG